MKKYLLAISFVFIAAILTAQNSGIQFYHGSWDEAVQKAKDENKLIFIDFYTKWCGPCRMMADEVFVTRAVGDFYNTNFINCKIDAETAEGAPLARKYRVGVYPTFVFVDPATLNAVHFSTSRQEEEIFLFTGQSAVSKDRNSVYLEKMVLEGSVDPTFMYNYAFYKNSKGDRDAADEYMSKLLNVKGYDLTNPLIWRYFTLFIKDRNNNLAVNFISEKDKYAGIYGEAAVNEILFTLYRSTRDETELDKVADFPGKNYLRKKCRLEMALQNKKYDVAKSIAEELMSNPDGRIKDFCNDINFIARMPFSKHGQNESIDPSLLQLNFNLLRFAAYNNPDRDDASSHFNYASILEYFIKNNIPVKELAGDTIKYGTSEYSMRPLDLAKKPNYKKLN